MDTRFTRTEALLGADAVARLRGAHVAVFGLGGVGGSLTEALARAGVGTLTLIDGDAVSVSNLNRQAFADIETVGMRKTEAAKRRIASVAPDCAVHTYDLFYLPENADAIDFAPFDYVADAVDTVSTKLTVIARARERGIPVISCMGTGNKLHPELFEVADIEKTSVCPLARVMRRELKIRGIAGVKVVYSKEEPCTKGIADGGKITPASVSFVPPAAGLIMAGEIIRTLANCGEM